MSQEQRPQNVITEDSTSEHRRRQPRGSAEDAFGRILKAVADGIARAARGGGPVALSASEAVSAVVRGAVRGSFGVAANSVVGTKAIVMGVMRGTQDRNDAALETLSHAARAVVRHTAEMNGDVGAAALGLMLGAITSARHMGVYPPRAASAARVAALDEAERIGAATAEKVRGALKRDVDESAVVT